MKMLSGREFARLVERLEAVRGLGDTVAGELQVCRVHLARILIVLDDEHQRAL